MKFRPFIFALITFLTGLGVAILGTLFKIMHWQFASEVFVFGTGLMVLGIIFTIIKLIQLYRKGT